MIRTLLAKPDTEVENLSRRDRNSLQQRKEMLRAALKLFSEKGYHNVSMHEIAKTAEFGIGTLYRYFNNKEELYKALIMNVAREHHDAILQVFEQERNPLRAIARYIAVRWKTFSDNLPFIRLYFAETRGASFNIKAGLDQDILKLYDEGMNKLASVFEQGIKDHEFRDVDPRQMALALDGIINAITAEFMRNPDQGHEEDILSTAVDIFFEGVLSK